MTGDLPGYQPDHRLIMCRECGRGVNRDGSHRCPWPHELARWGFIVVLNGVFAFMLAAIIWSHL